MGFRLIDDELPLKGCNRFSSESLDAVRKHMVGQLGDHDLSLDITSRGLNFRHHSTKISNLSLYTTDYGLVSGKVIIDMPCPRDLLLLQFSLAGMATIETADGTFASPAGTVTAFRSDRPFRQVRDFDYRHISIAVPYSKILPILCQELNLPSIDLVLTGEPLRIEGRIGALARFVVMLCDEANQGDSSFFHPRIAETVEQCLMRLILVSMPHNYRDRFDVPAAGSIPYYVRRVERFIDDELQLDQHITFDDLLRISGVSARSLYSGFRRFRNTTPMNHLKVARLNLARSLLGDCSDTQSTVTQVALKCGLTHLSKFAKDYNAMFGELPSETLLRVRRLQISRLQ